MSPNFVENCSVSVRCLGGRVASCLSVGGVLFRTHSEQRARASRGRKVNAFNDVVSNCLVTFEFIKNSQ